MKLKTKLVMPTVNGIWARDYELPIAPFVGLGIRLDVYEIFNVQSVVVSDFAYDVTCIGMMEKLDGVMVDAETLTEEYCKRLGFVEGLYP